MDGCGVWTLLYMDETLTGTGPHPSGTGPTLASLAPDSSHNISYWNRAITTGTGPWNQTLKPVSLPLELYQPDRAAGLFRRGSGPTGPCNETVLLELDQLGQLDQPDRATCPPVHRPLAGSWFWSRHEDHVARLLSKILWRNCGRRSWRWRDRGCVWWDPSNRSSNCLVPWLGSNLVAHRSKLMRRL